MSELLYPEQQRCRTCRKYFAFDVILRLYCSEKCAGIPDRPLDPRELPRQCRVLHYGQWQPKAVYLTPFEAGRAARLHKKFAYFCEPPVGCGRYHIASREEPRS